MAKSRELPKESDAIHGRGPKNLWNEDGCCSGKNRPAIILARTHLLLIIAMPTYTVFAVLIVVHEYKVILGFRLALHIFQ